MRETLFFSICLVYLSLSGWHYDLQEAKQIAEKEHKHILLNFSGSDWCGPCIRMHNEIFETEVFKKMADTELVLLNADFPRKKKNQLPASQQEMNNLMADQYNSAGKFPYTLLLDEKGKILKEWDGFPSMTAAAFSLEVRNGIYTDRKK
jgi:thioredoxin-related protein